MKLFLKILFFIFTMIITVGEIKSSTVVNTFRETSSSFLQESELIIGVFENHSKGTFKTDYVGNVTYENDSLKCILVDGEYYENGIYYFYVQDHLGNNRIVANQSGTVVQSTQYYPFGMAFADGVDPSAQPYKFGGKELDMDRGLNWSDSQARYMMHDVPGFTTPDPLAEMYYAISPYVYCGNNPVKHTDPTGMWIQYNDSTGSYRYNNGQ